MKSIQSPTIFLSKIVPMRSIACLVPHSSRTTGLSFSDPYLSYAYPVGTFDFAETKRLLRDEKAGGLILARPLLRRLKSNDDASAILDEEWSIPIHELENIYTLDQIQRMAQQNEQQWKDNDLDLDHLEDLIREHGETGVDAAIQLNQFLWKHTGGWQNTFG